MTLGGIFCLHLPPKTFCSKSATLMPTITQGKAFLCKKQLIPNISVMAAIPANHPQPQKRDWREEPADCCWSLQAGGQTPSALWVCSLSLPLLLTPPCQRDVLSAPSRPPGQGSWRKLPGRCRYSPVLVGSQVWSPSPGSEGLLS